MDVLRSTETNLMGTLHGCHYKNHTHTYQFSSTAILFMCMYYTVHAYFQTKL